MVVRPALHRAERTAAWNTTAMTVIKHSTADPKLNQSCIKLVMTEALYLLVFVLRVTPPSSPVQ